ncbi:hypothetical protein KEC56_05000 [Microbacterium sp. YMB-B2]|uniref:alpha-L-rhamnosidase n=1 Tax=Microbacterium tenebrionis TaxID=2830665 RepID=A0A9X1LNI1_9MICO|nr:alpha-L-rhamnosidase C-terminal domain-containing protein [Microbacterium tenebrionis]MCC2028881.1 hypothetical protein [Microbacterium tenebrionis]
MAPPRRGTHPILDRRRTTRRRRPAYFEHSTRTLAAIAEILGKDTDHERYLVLADHIRRAWRARFLTDDGRIGTDRQDDYVRAIAFGLLDDAERPAAAQRLIGLVEKAGGHLGTGFLSTPLLLGTLVDTGHTDVAWDLLLSTSSPSWLHQVERGATTVWETWEGYTKSGRAKMSHNHYALGSVARFPTERIGGITPLEPAYRTIGVRPLIGGGLTRARSTVHTRYGTVESSWRIDGHDVEYVVTIPPGTTGRFHAAGDTEPLTLTPGTYTIRRQENH